MRTLALLLVGVLLNVPARAAEPGAAARASAAYYAALVASAHGNTDATNRQLLLLAARWDAAVQEARTAVPPALAKDPAWGAALEHATTMLARARELARTRDIAGAHAELEEIRLMLHELRERHGVWVLDDHLAEYHEMIERVAGHASARSEINLTPRDYQDIDEDLRGAQDAWAGVEKSEGSLRTLAVWQQASRAAAAALQEMSRAVAAKDRAAVSDAAERLKNTYYDLLTAVSKARS